MWGFEEKASLSRPFLQEGLDPSCSTALVGLEATMQKEPPPPVPGSQLWVRPMNPHLPFSTRMNTDPPIPLYIFPLSERHTHTGPRMGRHIQSPNHSILCGKEAQGPRPSPLPCCMHPRGASLFFLITSE